MRFSHFASSVLLLVSSPSALGCASTSPAGLDSAASDAVAPVDGALSDAPAFDAFVDPAVDASTCSCRSGRYHATGTGSGFTVDYLFELEECGGVATCTVGHSEGSLSPTPCMMTPDGVFRVYLDTAGYVQLIFQTTPCDGTWMGSYATEGGTASITATRI